MARRRIFAALAAAAVAATAAPAPAIDLGFGLFKRRKPAEQPQSPAKPDPAVKVKQLLATLQSDPDVDRRKTAVTDLRAHEPRSHSDVIPTLVGTLQKDPSPEVRTLAAETIAGYRSVYQTAAVALETSAANDPDKAVRAAAKAALWEYGLHGYTASAPAASSGTGEPPLARPAAKPPAAPPTGRSSATTTEVQFRPITQGPAGPAGVYSQSAEPPLARSIDPTVVPQPPAAVTAPPVPQRMPTRLDAPAVRPPQATADAPRPPAKTVPANTVLPPPAVVVPPPTTAASRPVERNPGVPLPLPAIPSVPLAMPTVQPPGK